jgi:hypothetical protein
MAAYLSAAQLAARVGGSDRYVELTDDDNDGAADPGVETFVLGQVNEILDGFARRGGYTVPLALSDTAEIEPFLLDIANYKIKTRGDRIASADDLKLYNDAMLILNDIALGVFKLPSFTSEEVITLFGLDSPEDGPLFSRETLRFF